MVTAAMKHKHEFLGMPFGTAAHRLRKQILFRYVQAVGDDICFKCQQKIHSVEELSIEHKEPWLYVSAELFWDQDNIAFSHLRCNTPHRFTERPTLRNQSPPGLSWCCNCKEYRPVDEFSPSKRRWNGIQPECRSCKQRHKLRYKE